MSTRTKLKFTKSNDLIVHGDALVLLGSCFSDNIGKLLNKYSFNAVYNTIGIVYNPTTLSRIIHLSLNNEPVLEKHIKQNKDVFCHFDFHSKYNSLDKQKVCSEINADLMLLNTQLGNCKYLFLTLGTAITHVLKETEQLVGNCHKFPAKLFKKQMLEVTEIQQQLSDLVKSLKQHNPKIEIIFTLSPVRHIKEGIVENSQSKARLLSAISTVVELEKNASYFPSYEIMMDELRDYSFYKADKIHPNKSAIQFIWNYLGDQFFSERTQDINKKLNRILVSAKHKAFHPRSQEHQKFLKHLLKQIDELENEVGVIQLNSIRKKIKKQIINPT